MKKFKNKKAVVYTRVSTNEQKTYNNSIVDQKYRVEDFCQQNGISIIKDFEEVYSGKDFNRPIYKEMLEFIQQNKNKVDFILVSTWDRFGRNSNEAMREIGMFSDYGVDVNSIEQWIDHDDPTNFLLLLMNLGMPIRE